MMIQGWDWNSLSAMVTKLTLESCGRGISGLRLEVHTIFIPRWCAFGSVPTIHFSWTVPMSHHRRLRLEFILCNGHHKLTLKTWEGEILAWGLRSSLFTPIDGVRLDQYTPFIVAGLFQCLIIYNVDFGVLGGGGTSGLRSSLFIIRWFAFGSVWAIPCSRAAPMSYHRYNKWWYNIEIGIHCLQWSPQAHLFILALMSASSIAPSAQALHGHQAQAGDGRSILLPWAKGYGQDML